jgi:hypothetical protein
MNSQKLVEKFPDLKKYNNPAYYILIKEEKLISFFYSTAIAVDSLFDMPSSMKLHEEIFSKTELKIVKYSPKIGKTLINFDNYTQENFTNDLAKISEKVDIVLLESIKNKIPNSLRIRPFRYLWEILLELEKNRKLFVKRALFGLLNYNLIVDNSNRNFLSSDYPSFCIFPSPDSFLKVTVLKSSESGEGTKLTVEDIATTSDSTKFTIKHNKKRGNKNYNFVFEVTVFYSMDEIYSSMIDSDIKYNIKLIETKFLTSLKNKLISDDSLNEFNRIYLERPPRQKSIPYDRFLTNHILANDSTIVDSLVYGIFKLYKNTNTKYKKTAKERMKELDPAEFLFYKAVNLKRIDLVVKFNSEQRRDSFDEKYFKKFFSKRKN